MTVKEVSELLGMTVQGVRYLIKTGKLSAKMHGRDWVVSKASVDKYLAKKAK